MKLAIMQPYFVPYIGYFQLMNAVDNFIIYDDVNFIKKGWIHRNKILINKNEQFISLSLSKASQNKKINEIEICPELKWKQNLLKTIYHQYNQSNNFSKIYPMIESWLKNENLSKLLINSLFDIKNYLNIKTNLIISSEITTNQNKKGIDRIIDTCIQQNAKTYINAINGKHLYDKDVFKSNNINLFFINMKYPNYSSILDILMKHDKNDIQEKLNEYYLL